MARLPEVGGDSGNWGEILNSFLLESHNDDGSLKTNSVVTGAIANTAITTPKLIDNAVTSAKLADDAVDTAHIQSNSVTEPKLAAENSPSDGDYLAWNGTALRWQSPVTQAVQDMLDAKATGPTNATDNALVRFDGTTGKLIKSSNATLDDTGKLSVSPETNFTFSIQSSSNAQWTAYSSAAGTRGQFRAERYRGTPASPAAVVAEDYILSLAARAYDGTVVQQAAAVDIITDGTPVSNTSVPMRIGFTTGSNATNRAERLTIKSSGRVGIGTTNPSTLLHVNGDVTIAGVVSGITNPTNPQDAANKNYVDQKITGAMGVVVHGAVASVSRPTGYAAVTWIGSVQPTNAITNDIWVFKA